MSKISARVVHGGVVVVGRDEDPLAEPTPAVGWQERDEVTATVVVDLVNRVIGRVVDECIEAALRAETRADIERVVRDRV